MSMSVHRLMTVPSFNLFLIFSLLVHASVFTFSFLHQEQTDQQPKRLLESLISIGIRTANAGVQAKIQPSTQTLPASEVVKESEPEVLPPVEEAQQTTLQKSENPMDTPTPKPTLAREINPVKEEPIATAKDENPKKVKKRKENTETKAKDKEPKKKKSLEKQKLEPKPEKKQAKPKQQMPAVKSGNQGVNGSISSQYKEQETGEKHQSAASIQEELFAAKVRTHLFTNKKYPRKLKLKREEGQVVISFTLNRNGRVVDYQIVSRKGSIKFEKAVKRLIKRAQPFPLPNDALAWNSKKFDIAINYQLD